MADAQQGGIARRKVLVVAGGAGLVSLGGVIGATFIKSPEQLRAEAAAPDKTVLTASVEKRVLASTVVTRGEVRAAHQVEVTPAVAQGAATLVVTGSYTQPGAQVRSGDVLLSVSGRPLIALTGQLPAYRDMRPGDRGPDVEQLQAALKELNDYSGGDGTGVFGSATKQAIRRFYQRIGYAVPDTGGLNGRGDLPALRAAADAVEGAQHQVDTLKAAGNTDAAQLEAAKRKLARAKDDQAALIATTGPMMPMAETAFVASFPANVIKVGAVGQVVRAPLIVLSTGALEVVCRMRPDQAAALKEGMRVKVTSESLGAEAAGVVASIGPLTVDSPTDQAGGGQSGAYRLVTVTPAKAFAQEWNSQDVRVMITAAQTPGEVLVVPVSALSAGADGTTTVTVVTDEGQQTLVEVRLGISGDGFVEVSGALTVGSKVVIGK